LLQGDGIAFAEVILCDQSVCNQFGPEGQPVNVAGSIGIDCTAEIGQGALINFDASRFAVTAKFDRVLSTSPDGIQDVEVAARAGRTFESATFSTQDNDGAVLQIDQP
jgi:hypothetical protein